MNHVQSSRAVTAQELERTRRKPDMMPQTVNDFKRMSFQERQWLYENRRELYNRFSKQEKGENTHE